MKSKAWSYAGYEIEQTWDLDENGRKVKGSDNFFIFDDDGKPLSIVFKTLAETKAYIDEIKR